MRQVLGEPARRSVDVAELYREVQQRWDTYFILPKQSHYCGDQQVAGHWRALLGERLLLLDDPAAVCEMIALTIGLGEGAIDLTDGLVDLHDVGSAHGRRSAGRWPASARAAGRCARIRARSRDGRR